MTYTPEWEPIAAALKRLVDTGMARNEAKSGLCRAIADRKIRIRVHLAADPYRNLPEEELSGADLTIPSRLSPKDIDWRTSRPLSPWTIVQRRPGETLMIFAQRAAHLLDRTIEMIEVRVSDVSRALCAPGATRKVAGEGGQKVQKTINSETACRQELIRLMKAHPDNPIPKSELRKKFSSVSIRGLDRAYAAAVREANTPAWGAPGRRRKNRNAVINTTK